MNDWITNRLPTEADGDEVGCVIVTYDDGVCMIGWSKVKAGQPWMPCPPPYVAPDLCSMPCHRCIEEFDLRHPDMQMFRLDAARMILCDKCSNKRCPHASDHRLECSGSNDPGQQGSIYVAPKPEPDTSLAASIERMEQGNQRDVEYPLSRLWYDDLNRITEAARMWAEKKSKPFPWHCVCGHESIVPAGEYLQCNKCGTEWGNSFEQYKANNDPDGVGEGWRKVGNDEPLEKGDEYLDENETGGWKESEAIERWRNENLIYRRRLETPEPASPAASHVAEGQAETQPRERNDKPQGKPREWWLLMKRGKIDIITEADAKVAVSFTPMLKEDGYVHVREVNAEMAAWTAKLIELCDSLTRYSTIHGVSTQILISEHMKARPQ